MVFNPVSSLDSIAFAGSPYQWAIAGIIVVAIFAPKLLPIIARMIGIEVRRKIGFSPFPGMRPRFEEPRIGTDSPTEHPSVPPIESKVESIPIQRSSSAQRMWAVAVLTVVALAVLLWALLR